LIKASLHLKDKSKNRNYQIHKNPSQAEEGTNNKNWTLWFSISFSRKKGLW